MSVQQQNPDDTQGKAEPIPMQGLGETEPLLTERATVDIGCPSIALVHLPGEYLISNGLPIDGEWSPTWIANDMRISRNTFRTFHAAAYYVLGLQQIEGAMGALRSREFSA